ncbi:MAG: acetate--CoA ligase family protein, partial [Bacteroidota bacterium]
MLPKLNRVFNPKSIAVIGGSERSNSLGQAVFRNLIQAKFQGTLYAINPKHRRVYGFPCLRNVKAVGHPVDLAIIATPFSTVAGLVKECSQIDCGGILILTNGFREESTQSRAALRQIHKVAQKAKIPILGPDALGIINPHQQLNASYSQGQPKAGRVAFISQSNALCASILRRAETQKVGFSYFVSMEKVVNVHLGDLIDYFGADSRTSSILVYLESLEHAKKFMSAARAFSRNKPILVLKTDAETHEVKAPPIAQLISNDQAFTAAFRRAGIIRVEKLSQLFNCAQALALQPRPTNNRLAIISNAVGPANLAIDRLRKHGGQLAHYSTKESNALQQAVGAPVVQRSLINLSLHFLPDAFEKSLTAQIKKVDVDGILVILSPFGPEPSTSVVSTIIKTTTKSRKPIFVVLMGEGQNSISKQLLDEGKIPVYRFPESAVDVFLYMWRYQRNIALLQETPPIIPQRFSPDRSKVTEIIQDVRSEERIELTGREARSILAAYDLPFLPGKVATSSTAARKLAQEIGFPAVLKLEGLGIGSKSMLGGVNLSIRTQQQAADFFQEAKANLEREKPEATFEGFRVEPRARQLYELVVLGQYHPLFGPMISFGLGGIAYRVFQDMAVGLPPLT